MNTRPLIAIALLLALAGCAGDFGGAYDDATAGVDGLDAKVNADASMRLYAHDVKGAHSLYADDLASFPSSGHAAAGFGVTSILLLPYTSSATSLLTGHLGARNALDTHGDVLWDEGGLAYFLARGVAWEDSASTAGIKTLLMDRLPWSRQQLDTVDGFVTGLNNPVSMMAPALSVFAGELVDVAEALHTAVRDTSFETYFLPGAVFHDDSLDLHLGKSELSALRGVALAGAAALNFFAAYDHAWTLERALGESVWAGTVADPMDPDHVPGAEVVDYQVAHVNESFARAIDAMGRLDDARTNARGALLAFADALNFGADETLDTALQWRTVDDAAARRFAEFLTALADSLDARTTLPYTEPAQSADFSVLFEGRVLGEEQNFFVVSRFDDGLGGYESTVDVDGDAMASFLDGIFDPDFDSDPAPELTIAEEIDALFQTVASDVSDDYERSVAGAF